MFRCLGPEASRVIKGRVFLWCHRRQLDLAFRRLSGRREGLAVGEQSMPDPCGFLGHEVDDAWSKFIAAQEGVPWST